MMNIMPNQITRDPYEQREIAAAHGYYEDPRWEEVHRLRSIRDDSHANGLVSTINRDWGVD